MIDYRFTLHSASFGTYVLADGEEPVGWDSISFKLYRNPEYHGIFSEISTSLSWVGQPYTFITDCYNSDGVDAEVSLFIDFKMQNETWERLYTGILDLTTARWTDRFLDCDIKPDNCLDLFFSRNNVQVNLYESPGFSELTMDKTAYRTRYAFAPYLVNYHELPLPGESSWVLDPDFTPPSTGSVRRFSFRGGAGCTLFLCDGGVIPCGYSTSCDNLIGGNLQTISLIQPFPINILNDDLDIFSTAGVSTDETQWVKDCGFNDVFSQVPGARKWNIEEDNIGQAAKCPCHNYTVEYSLSGSFEVVLSFPNITDGRVEFVRVEPRVVFRWGKQGPNNTYVGYERISYIGPTILGTGVAPCTPYVAAGGSYVIGSDTFNVTDSFTIDSCDPNETNIVRSLDFLSIHVEYVIGGIYEQIPLGGTGASDVIISTNFASGSGTIRTTECIPEALPVGETLAYVFAAHESFSRIAEHVTNNCLRVKSSFFGRPNSMQWGDDCFVQNAAIPGPLPCDCNNITSFPDCNVPFDITPYQYPDFGCGGNAVITSGIALRQFGTECFVSFEDLYEAMRGIYNIGLGWTEGDKNNLYIEDINEFYKDDVVIDFGFFDLYKSKYRQEVATDYYYNNFKFGYQTWLEDLQATENVIHSEREYSVPLKNLKQDLEQNVSFIADPYATEYQRRQRYTISGRFDDEKFIHLVGKDTNPANTINVIIQGNPYTLPYNQYNISKGVQNSNFIADPVNFFNYEIRPYSILARWANVLQSGSWNKDNTEDTLLFSKGVVNFIAEGEAIVNTNCIGDEFSKENNNYTNFLRDPLWFPEIISIEIPVTPFQYRLLKYNPYGTIVVNGEKFFLLSLDFKPNENSKLSLLRKYNHS